MICKSPQKTCGCNMPLLTINIVKIQLYRHFQSAPIAIRHQGYSKVGPDHRRFLTPNENHDGWFLSYPQGIAARPRLSLPTSYDQHREGGLGFEDAKYFDHYSA
jgi:hypothetical protein